MPSQSDNQTKGMELNSNEKSELMQRFELMLYDNFLAYRDLLKALREIGPAEA